MRRPDAAAILEGAVVDGKEIEGVAELAQRLERGIAAGPLPGVAGVARYRIARPGRGEDRLRSVPKLLEVAIVAGERHPVKNELLVGVQPRELDDGVVAR